MANLILLPDEITSFQNKIWSFYHAGKREFAWRGISDPYAVLVSEMMLQQTQTQRVVPKYEEWMKAFPTARSLAEASLSEVLSHWVGLGYNRRALFLQKACQAVCSEYNEVFPQSQEALQKLPGIGPYTAGAVSTFAFNQPNVFIETNIRSVYIHFFFSDALLNDETKKIDDRDIAPLVEVTLDRSNPREWYYALMDYGADLKKKVVNPSRKSRQYTRQSRFEGSLRQARGAILRQLSQKESASLAAIAKYEDIDLARLERAADKLLAEHLITGKGGIYRIYN